MNKIDLDGAFLANSHFEKANFKDSKLLNTSFLDAELYSANFDFAILFFFADSAFLFDIFGIHFEWIWQRAFKALMRSH